MFGNAATRLRFSLPAHVSSYYGTVRIYIVDHVGLRVSSYRPYTSIVDHVAPTFRSTSPSPRLRSTQLTQRQGRRHRRPMIYQLAASLLLCSTASAAFVGGASARSASGARVVDDARIDVECRWQCQNRQAAGWLPVPRDWPPAQRVPGEEPRRQHHQPGQPSATPRSPCRTTSSPGC